MATRGVLCYVMPGFAVFAIVVAFAIHVHADTREIKCSICPDPYRSMGVSNIPAPNDKMKFMWVRTKDGLKAVRNPRWKGNGNRSKDEPESQKGCKEDSASDQCVATRPVDRSNSAYHTAGYDIFRADILQNIGGVISQKILLHTSFGNTLTAAVELGASGSYPGYILVGDGNEMLQYAINYADLVPMALFVDSGGTSLYTLWDERLLPTNFPRDAGFVRYREGGYVALEFGGTRYAHALYFVDTCMVCLGPSDRVLTEKMNVRLTGGQHPRISSASSNESYVNVDIGAPFRLESDFDNALVLGGIYRFYWAIRNLQPAYVAIRDVQPLISANDLPTQAKRATKLAEKNVLLDDQIASLMQGEDLRERLSNEGTPLSRHRLTDAHFLFETLALLRSVKIISPGDWSVFMQSLSSEIMVNAEREPWELYTRSFCSVYGDAYECSERNSS